MEVGRGKVGESGGKESEVEDCEMEKISAMEEKRTERNETYDRRVIIWKTVL